jgi:peptidoglycan-associated lipoprotein
MRRILLPAILGLILVLLAAGCAKRSTVGQPGGAEGEGAAQETVSEKRARLSGLDREDITGRYIEDSTVSFDDIYFDFDKYNIKGNAKPVLKEVSSWLLKNDAKLLVEGHCDERGTNEYNLGLGDRRSSSAKQYLVASGVPSVKIETMSYGEEKPQCVDKSERCWSKNRRAHFVVLLPK